MKFLRGTAAIFLFVSGCGGSAPNPVVHYTPGDEKRNCASLKAEIASNEVQLIRLVKEESYTTSKNVVLGITGVFLIVPWFFMDLKGKEGGEIEALRHRNRTLRQFAGTKECNVPAPKVQFEEELKETKKPKK